MKKVFGAAMVLTGSFIGAGFATGRELVQYFGIFGNFGFLGVFISCVILGLFTYCTAINISVMGHRKYIKSLCSYSWVNIMLNCYMAVIFATMLSAFGESLNTGFGISKIYGVVLMDIISVLIICFGVDGMLKFNTFVTPAILIGIFWLFAASFQKEVFAYNNFVSSSVVYTSYNIVSLPFVMVGMEDVFENKKSAFWISLVFAVSILVPALCMLWVLKGVNINAPIPLLDVVSQKYNLIFLVVLALAMLTTAVSNGYGFVNSVKYNKMIWLILLGVFGFFFAFFDFGFIVKYCYGLFGYGGIYILLKNFHNFIKIIEKRRKAKKKRYNHIVNPNNRL